jgi:hypothetical protein
LATLVRSSTHRAYRLGSAWLSDRRMRRRVGGSRFFDRKSLELFDWGEFAGADHNPQVAMEWSLR